MVKLLMRSRDAGFTIIEILVSITILAVGTLVLGGLLLRASRSAEAASAVTYQTAALRTEVGRLSTLPFASLAAGTTCDTTAVEPFARIRCSTVTNVSTKVRTVKVKVTATNNPELVPDSVMFERSVSVDVNPLNTP